MDLNTRHLVDIALDAMQRDSESPPGVGARVFADAVASGKSLHAAWSGPRRDALTSHGAFLKTAAEFGDLLDSLTPEDWEQPTVVPDATVKDLVAHLVGIERYLLGQLGRGPRLDAPHREDHLAVSRRAAAELAGAPNADIARAWWVEVMNVIAACSELGPDHPLDYHHLTGAVRGVLVVRTFELWTHGDDIRRATGRPADPLDAARLGLMTNELMDMLAFGMGMAGTTRPGRTATFHLTGPGGGTFEVALAPGDDPGPSDVAITASAIELCRFVANRVRVDDLDVLVDGDRSLLEPILVGAGAFAFD